MTEFGRNRWRPDNTDECRPTGGLRFRAVQHQLGMNRPFATSTEMGLSDVHHYHLFDYFGGKNNLESGCRCLIEQRIT